MTRKIIILWNAPKNIIKAIIKEWSYFEKKGWWTSERTAHAGPARQHRTGGVAATLCSSGKERLIVSLQKSKQSDCEEKAGAGFVTFKLGSAYGLPFCCQLDDSVGKGMCSQRWLSKLHSWDPCGGSRELTPWPSHKWKINCNFKQLKKSSTAIQNSEVTTLTERSIYIMMESLNIKIKNRNKIPINKITLNS